MVRKMRPNAITLDLGLSDIDGFVLLDLLRHDPETADIPVHVISGAEQADCADHRRRPGDREAADRDRLTGCSPVDRRSRPPATRRANAARRAAQGQARSVPEIGPKILIIDDDIRNIYSLTSVLEVHGVEVLHAERGAEGIAILEAKPDIDVALVDIMMPDMDGYETMRGSAKRRESPTSAGRGDRQGDEGRPPEVPRRRALPIISPSRSISTCCWR